MNVHFVVSVVQQTLICLPCVKRGECTPCGVCCLADTNLSHVCVEECDECALCSFCCLADTNLSHVCKERSVYTLQCLLSRCPPVCRGMGWMYTLQRLVCSSYLYTVYEEGCVYTVLVVSVGQLTLKYTACVKRVECTPGGISNCLCRQADTRPRCVKKGSSSRCRGLSSRCRV